MHKVSSYFFTSFFLRHCINISRASMDGLVWSSNNFLECFMQSSTSLWWSRSAGQSYYKHISKVSGLGRNWCSQDTSDVHWHQNTSLMSTNLSRDVRFKHFSLVGIWLHSSYPIFYVQGTSWGCHLLTSDPDIRIWNSWHVRFWHLQDVPRASVLNVSYMSKSDYAYACLVFLSYQYRHRFDLGFFCLNE